MRRASRPARTPEAAYRGRQVSGLLLLGGIVLSAALLRANWHELFPVGWWHVW